MKMSVEEKNGSAMDKDAILTRAFASQRAPMRLRRCQGGAGFASVRRFPCVA
jgi:hypothetical protein